MQKALFRLIPMLLAFAVLAGCGSARPENTSAPQNLLKPLPWLTVSILPSSIPTAACSA